MNTVKQLRNTPSRDADADLGKRAHMLIWSEGRKQGDVAEQIGMSSGSLGLKLKGNRGWALAKTIAIAAAALVVGGVVGGAIGYQVPQAELAQARVDHQAELTGLVTNTKRQIADAEEGVAERDRELTEREKALEGREAAVQVAEQVKAESEFGGGVQTVGTSVAAGTYSTTVTSGMCYYVWKTGTGADADIVDNNIVKEGPATVTLVDGQVFESNGCGTWVRQ